MAKWNLDVIPIRSAFKSFKEMEKMLVFLAWMLLSNLSNAQQQTFVTSDSVTLFLNVKGKGMPCLYIHGGPGSGSYWMEKFSGDILEERFQMIYLDLRGVGRSGSPSNGNYTMERMLQDFEEIRKHLGIDNWIVMGHSFSGTMVTEYAYRHPSSISAMMMFNCSLDLNESITTSWMPKAIELLGIQDHAFYKSDTVSTNEKLQRIFPLLNEKGLMWKLAYANEESEKMMNETFNEIPNWNYDFAGIGLNHEDYLKNFKVYTADIKIPVLFFYGEYDWTIGPEHYKGVNFPNMYLWKSKVGHVPFMENKKDIEKAIDKFFKKIKKNGFEDF